MSIFGGLKSFLDEMNVISKEVESNSKAWLSDVELEIQAKRMTADLDKASRTEVSLINLFIEDIDIQRRVRKSPELLKKFNGLVKGMNKREVFPITSAENVNYDVVFSSPDEALRSKGEMVIKGYQEKIKSAFLRLDSEMKKDPWIFDYFEESMKKGGASEVLFARYLNYREGKDWLKNPFK